MVIGPNGLTGALEPLLDGHKHLAVTVDAAFLDFFVGEAAEYNSACVNTLRRSRTILNSPAPERNLLEPFHIQNGS